ncbi:MAG: efflux RND transporter periplasmic adaptor subunit [Acidaminobacteraceae bacterium]
MKKVKKLRRRNVIVMSVIIVFVAAGVFVNMNKQYEVEIEIVDSGRVEKLIEEIAEVKSSSRLVIHSNVSGTIKDVFVSEGDYVNISDKLVVIDEGSLEYDIKSAKLMIASLDAEFKEAIKPADKNRLSIAENNVKSTKVSMDQAKKMYDDNMKLLESGSISESDLEKIRVNYEILNASYQNSLSELSIIIKGASSNISDKFNSEIENLSIGLEKMRDMQMDYHINSPISALVTEKYVSSGDYAMAGTKLVELMNTTDIYLQAEVLDSDAVNIMKGSSVKIIFEDVNYDGVVEKVYPKAYNKVSDLGIVQKRIKVDIKILSEDTILRLGQEVDVQFVEDLVDKGLRLFRDYVYDSDNKKFVLILENGIIVEREVELALEGEDYYLVVNGVSLGEKVITNFGDELVVGSKAREK